MMQTSVLGRIRFQQASVWQSKHLVRGFTLLELILVLVIVGISLGLVTPNFIKNDDDMLKEESMRLVALLEYAADTASSQGHWLAWSPTASGYRFLQRNEDKSIWQPITTDDVLRERQLPEGMHIATAINKQAVTSAGSMITLSPTGIQSPFQIELIAGKTMRVVSGNILGKVEMLKPALAGAQ